MTVLQENMVFTLKATISLGVAAFPTDAQSGEQLVLKADSALYWAKQHGRNRVSKVADTEEVAPTQTIGATRS